MMIIQTKNLLAALTKTQKVVAVKSSQKVLESVFCTAEGDTLKLFATDLTKYFIAHAKLESYENNFNFTISDIKATVQKLKMFGDFTQISVVDDVVEFTSDNRTMKQLLLDFKMFPSFPELKMSHDIVSYNMETLKKRVDKIAFATEKDKNTCKLLNKGIIFDDDNMVACDGFRLALSNDTSVKMPKCIVDAEALKVATGIMTQGNTIIELSDNKYFAMINESTGDTMIIRVYEGEPFNYKSVLAGEIKNQVEFNTSTMIQDVKYLKLTADTAKDKKHQYIKWFGTKLVAEGMTGTAEVKINLETGIDPIGFNSKYMLEALQHCESDTVKADFTGAVSPIKIHDGQDIFLVLPVRLPR